MHRSTHRSRVAALHAVLLLAASSPGALRAQVGPYDSGGPLMPEQAAYDVTFYDLALSVDPEARTIRGTLTVTARIVHPTPWLVLDLDPRLDVGSMEEVPATGAARPLSFHREGGKIWAALPRTRQPGETIRVRVAYGGTPREAPNAPWDGGFSWARTPSGAHWIATTGQSDGADLWWPVKDHVSDEPDSMRIRVTVPEPLVVASNGRLLDVEEGDGVRTYDWFVSTPINTYNVALNIAPYRTLEWRRFESVSGDPFPVVLYVLPEDYENGERLLPEIREHLRFYEETLGPYPFRADKYGVAQTPHLGMEHQTIIAYGAGFRNTSMTGGTDWGFDALHHHELSHEWWGNLVTNVDWSDMWLHEGFGTYMQPLYLEWKEGPEAYHAYLASIRGGIQNRIPVAPRGTWSADSIYGGDIYSKGAWVLHTLRFLVGDEPFRMALRRMAYPTPALEAVTDGSQCRFATTDDFLHLVEGITGRELGWFFEVYLRQPDLPRLRAVRRGTRLELEWEVPGGLPFPMPVEVSVDGEVRRVEMTTGRAILTISPDAEVEVDPVDRILREGNGEP